MRLARRLRPIFLLGLIIIGMIIFESYQQHYYITQFDIFEDEVFISNLLSSHLRRWFIWLVVTFPLALIVYKYTAVGENSSRNTIFYTGFLLISLTVSLLAITFVEISFYHNQFSTYLFDENLTFFFFQKGPIYTLANMGVIGFIRYQAKIKEHELVVGEFRTLKGAHQRLYEEFKSKAYGDEEKFIHIKIGSQAKVIPIESIQWIEAEDYCVRLHTLNNGSYILRSSMKSMEQALPHDKFLRIHRKYIVNLKGVDRFFFSQSPEVQLVDNTRLTVAQSRVGAIKKHLAV
ncbi:MAG: LytTR family DNA-binding domain-containing protein [Bacteroidota bacterium]